MFASNRGVWTLWLAVATALGLRVWGITFGLPHLEARPDESVLIARAMGVLQGDLNPHFFNYPSLFIYVLAGIFGLLYGASLASGLIVSFDHFAALTAANPVPLYLCARLVSVFCGVATVIVVYALTRRLYDHRAGVAAAWLLAINYLHVRESHFGVTDIPLTMLITTAVAVAVKASESKRAADFALAGAVAGLAVSTKYNALLVALPLLLAAVAPPLRWRRALSHAALAAVLMAATALAGTPFALLDWEAFQRDVQFEMRHLQVGHAGVDLGHGWVRHALFTLPIAAGVPALMAAAAGVPIALRRRFWLSAIVWSFPAVYYVVAGSTRVVFVRYMALLIPFLAVAAAIGVVALADAFSARVPARLRPVVLVAAVLVASVSPLLRVIDFNRMLSRTDSRVVAAEWLSRQLPAGASVYQAGSSYEHLQLPAAHELRTFDRQLAGEGDADPDRPDWIVLPRSASPYSTVPPSIEDLVARCYQQVLHVRGAGGAPASAFDLQDAFFVPYAAPQLIERPGPDILVFLHDPARCGTRSAPAAP